MPASASGRDAHLDVPLSNLAIKAFAGASDYIAQRLFPIVPVDKQSGKYYIIDKDSWLRIGYSLRAPKTAPRRLNFKVSSDSYFANNYSLAGDNAKEDLANADTAVRLRQNTTDFVTNMLMRDYEDRVARKVTSGTNLGSYVSLSGTAKWSDYTNSDPLSDVSTAHAFVRQNTGLKANTMVIDEDTIAIIRRHPLLLDLFKYTAGGMVTQAQLQEAFDIQNVLIGRGIKNNALEGATASITNIWGNNVILCYVEPGVSLETATFGLSFRWTPAGLPLPMQVMRYDDPDPGKKVEIVEVGMYQDEKIVAKELSFGILNTL